jgi:Tfp pilus assembly protein PilN
MTTQIERPKARNHSATVLTSGLPQVNLLPQSVRAARGLRRTKRWLGVSLVATIVLCCAVYGLVLMSAAAADSDLADAQAETARLQNEQAKYAEVPQVLNALNQAKQARELGMSTDLSWSDYLNAIQGTLPPNVSIDTYLSTAATPMTASAISPDPLQPASVGQILFTARSSTVPDSAAWIDALDSIPGLAGATTSTVASSEDEGGVYYAVTVSVQITDKAYSHRFDANPEGN